jgi:hypothetical protein
VPGFPPPPEPDPKTGETVPYVQWPLALRFYYYATLARALDFLPDETRERRRAELRGRVAAMQMEDGRWENPAHHMRENDPLIATSLALVALA